MALMMIFLALALPWPLLFWLGRRWEVVLLAASLFLFCRSMAESNWQPLIYELVAPKMRATAIGVSNCTNCIFGGLGAVLGGLSKERLGLQMSFGLVSMLLVVVLVLLAFSYSRLLEKDLSKNSVTLAHLGALKDSGSMS